MVPNCPIAVQDIKNAEFIWGPDLGCVKGKTARKMAPNVRVENTSIPVTIMQQYKISKALSDRFGPIVVEIKKYST